MNTREIFLDAWKLARQGARRFGGKAREYFAQSLKWVYANLKESRMNTFLIAEETERKANQCLQVANVCLFMVACLVGLLVPALAAFGLGGLLTMAGLGAVLLTVSGLAIRRCSRLDASQC